MPRKDAEKSAAKKVFFWDGVIKPEDLNTEGFDEAIRKLVRHELNGLNVEKLRLRGRGNSNFALYSYRASKSSRGYFTIYNHKIVLLAFDETHGYDDSFLNKGILKRFLDKNGLLLDEAISSQDFEAIDSKDENFQPMEQDDDAKEDVIDYEGIEYLDGRVIALTDEQGELLMSCKLPAVVQGVAGSGKSLMALLILKKYLRENPGEYACYVTKSPRLAENMADKAAQMDGLEQATFLSYEAFLKKRGLIDPQKEIITEDHFFEWYPQDAKIYPWPSTTNTVVGKKMSKMNELRIKKEQADLVYEEMKRCAGVNGSEEFCALGEMQTRLTSMEEKSHVYQIYTRYMAILERKKAVNLDFYRPTNSGHDDVIPARSWLMVDEAQDFGARELQIFMENSPECIFFVGEHQVLGTSISVMPLINQLYYNAGIELNSYSLPPITQRCPKRIATLVNACVRLKRIIAGRLKEE